MASVEPVNAFYGSDAKAEAGHAKDEKILCTLTFFQYMRLLTEADNEQSTDSNASDSADGFTWTEEEEKAVRWKLDKVIVPLTTFLYLLCFLDR